MLSFLLPETSNATTSPDFLSELLHLGRSSTESELKKYGGCILTGIPLLTVGWWLVERIRINFGYVPPNWQDNLVIIVFLFSAAFTLISSIYTISVTTNVVVNSFDSLRRDRLQAASPDNESLIKAYDAIAQIRSWRLSIVEVALRLATVILFQLNWAYSYWFTAGDSFWVTTVGNFICWFGVVIEMIILAAYVLEPLYRMKTVVALCIAIVTRLRSLSYGLLTGFLIIFLLHLLQIGAVLSILHTVISLSDPNADGIGGEILFVLPIGCLVTIYVFYFLYRSLRQKALSSAISDRLAG